MRLSDTFGHGALGYRIGMSEALLSKRCQPWAFFELVAKPIGKYGR